MDAQLSLIATTLLKLPRKKVIIKIDGRGGSGKSSIAKKLCEVLGNALCFNIDNYVVDGIDLFSDDVIKKKFAVDFSNTVYDEEAILKLISQSESKYIVIEGCFSFKNLKNIEADYQIWVEVPKDICAVRLNNRERNDPGRAHLSTEIIELSTKKWQESEENYIQNVKPQDLANVVITNE